MVGMLGDGIHTETTDVSMGRNTWISRSVAIIVMQNAIAIRLKIAWQQNIQHCAFQWHPSVTPDIIVPTQGKKKSVSLPGLDPGSVPLQQENTLPDGPGV